MPYPETRYARGKEGAVAYQVLGDGPLDLVFIPWWVSNVDAMWEEPSIASFLHRLSTFSRLLCFDKRGTGVSDPVPLAALPTLEQWSDDVRSVMQAVGSKRAALLGHGVLERDVLDRVANGVVRVIGDVALARAEDPGVAAYRLAHVEHHVLGALHLAD